MVSLHQAGIENVVASGGTSLTPDQLRLVKKYTKNLTIIYDGDAAGVKAALRGLTWPWKKG
ncbi:toprim domain-containing protein [Paraflavitalea speifideaquila]|uniref:toprim domain-containing protein n=1 Tax=Paraflavitalea speifideaquila TaxID=3076558 RepID=UPI003313080B